VAHFDEMPRHTLILDQETRWSSTHTMLERFMLQKKQLFRYTYNLKSLAFKYSKIVIGKFGQALWHY